MAASSSHARFFVSAVLGCLGSVALALGCGDVVIEPLTEPPPPSAGADGGAAGSAGSSSCGAPPFATCDGLCVHLPTDDNHCGECGLACVNGSHCAGSICQRED